MSIALLFWVLMLLWLVGGIGYTNRANFRAAVPDVLLFVVLCCLGYAVFGAAIHR